jgi:hypothetical protein
MSTTYMSDLGSIASDPQGGGSWWLAVGRGLDALMDRLSRDELVDEGPRGDVTEAVWTAPFLAPRASKLHRQRQALTERARSLRRRLAVSAGDPSEVRFYAEELAELAREEDQYRRRSRDLVWDSVTQDIGGE